MLFWQQVSAQEERKEGGMAEEGKEGRRGREQARRSVKHFVLVLCFCVWMSLSGDD